MAKQENKNYWTVYCADETLHSKIKNWAKNHDMSFNEANVRLLAEAMKVAILTKDRVQSKLRSEIRKELNNELQDVKKEIDSLLQFKEKVSRFLRQQGVEL